MIFDNEEKQKINLKRTQLNIYRFYAVNYPFYEMKLHIHDEWEIMYVVRGKCRVTCLTEGEEKTYELREGGYILIRGGIPHALTVEKACPCRILNLEGRMENTDDTGCMFLLRSEEVFKAFLSDPAKVQKGSDDGSLHNILKALIRELKQSKDFFLTDKNPMLGLLLGQFVLLIARQRMQAKENKSGRSVYSKKAQMFIEENFDREITASEIARAVGISEGYLQRLYKKENGFSMTEEILRLRIEKAKMLLENSTLPIVDIAVNVGFNSRQHFCAMFGRIAGCSPMVWRKQKGNISAFVRYEH